LAGQARHDDVFLEMAAMLENTYFHGLSNKKIFDELNGFDINIY
jgi:hypothetical protein